MESKEKDTITIFHIYRNDGTPLFLHPFEEGEKLFKLIDKSNIQGKYGNEPRIESLTMFRNKLYRMVETGVREWISEVRFIPRFLISAAVFLVAYMFFSFVIRDPIPVIDEIALSFGASLLSYIFLGKRYLNSEEAAKKRISMRSVIDRIEFTESGFIQKIEEELHKRESESMDDLVDSLIHAGREDLTPENKKEALELFKYLEKLFSRKDFKRKESMLAKSGDAHSIEKQKAGLKSWAQTKNADLPLFSLYVKLKKTFIGIK
jgi:hypothetical protein